MARIACGDKTVLLVENQSTLIAFGKTARPANSGTSPLEIIDLQLGSKLDVDDIVRFDDHHGWHQ